jgi:hypothetical protein
LSSHTAIRVFGPDVPSYAELAAESWELAFRTGSRQNSLSDRIEYALRAHRLSSAAQWERLKEINFFNYYRGYVLPRLVPALASALLGLYLWDLPDRAGPEFWIIIRLMLLAVAAASLWALLYWPKPLRDLVFAAQYRKARLDRERQLLSPEGWNGWRAERRGDGSYVMVPVEGLSRRTVPARPPTSL